MFVLGIGGGSGSGKTFLANKITENIQKDTKIVSMDRYYQPFSNLSEEEREQVNFQNPETVDWNLLRDHVKKLKTGREIKMPCYSYRRNTRTGIEEVTPPEILIVEGIHVFQDERLNDIIDFKVFLDVEPDIRAVQRMKRDIEARNIDPEIAAKNYIQKTRDAHEKHVEPAKDTADRFLERDQIKSFAENFSKQISKTEESF